MAKSIVLLIAVCSLAALAQAQTTKLKYTEEFSKVPWQEYPGGRYKASTSATLTATTIAGALFDLKPGGVRELHWHDAVEWALVISGSCKATVLDAGNSHPTDTWVFSAGDIWYFPSNLAHSIVGLEPEGCLFVTGYKSPSFDELTAFSASSWLATLPVETLAQSLGVGIHEAELISKRAQKNGPTFLPRGDVEVLASDTPSLPVQWPKEIHRFPLLQNTYSATNDDGSFINKADVSIFPVSKEMSGGIVRIAPGGMRQLHWHLNFDEWQFLINGTLEVGVFLAPGESETGVMYAGDLGFAPRGSGHYLKNIGKDWAYVVLIFNAGEFTDVEISNFLGSFPPSWTAASLAISTKEAEEINYELAAFAPALPHYMLHAQSQSRPEHKEQPARA